MMIGKKYLALVVAASCCPIIIALSLYNVIDCTKQTQNNYKAWLEQGNKGTFTDMIKACNSFHPMIILILIPTSPIIGIISYRMLDIKPINDEDKI